MPTPQPFVRRNRHTQHRQTQDDDIQYTQPRTTRPGPARRPSIDTDSVQTDEYDDQADYDDQVDYDDQPIITLSPSPDKRPLEKNKTRPQRSQPPLRQPQRPPLRSQQTTAAPKKRVQAKKQEPEKQREQRGQRGQGLQIHWLLLFGIGMLLMLGLYIGGFQLWNSATSIYNDWTYGTTRTYQLDAVVGDHDSASAPTHFIALNLHGTVDVIEIPGGDVTHAKVYSGPHLLWNQADKAVVTLEIKDINGDHQPDVLVHIVGNTTMLFQQATMNFVLTNTGAGFKPLSPLP